METFFLVCFVFGALFTAASFLLGALGGGLGHMGHVGHAGHLGHLGHDVTGGHVDHGGAPAGHVPHGPAGTAGGEQGGGPGWLSFASSLPIFNVTALLAFLTWFGAAGFVALRFGAWPLFVVLFVALAAGLIAALLIALFLRKILEGERVMDPADYRLQGTLARVTVSIPAGGVGEIIFTKAGTRRSEAARSATGRGIPRGAEVVILHNAHGIAAVQPWRELLGREEPRAPAETSPPGLPVSSDHWTT